MYKVAPAHAHAHPGDSPEQYTWDEVPGSSTSRVQQDYVLACRKQEHDKSLIILPMFRGFTHTGGRGTMHAKCLICL